MAGAARRALAARFGASWLAKTTEEIAAGTDLIEVFGFETTDRLLDLLREADRAKFSTRNHGEFAGQRESVEAWALWVETFVAAAGATSRINGK